MYVVCIYGESLIQLAWYACATYIELILRTNDDFIKMIAKLIETFFYRSFISSLIK